MESNFYHTVLKEGINRLNVKGSRFIGCANVASTGESAEGYIRRLSQQYHDATHHCYAYRIGLGDQAITRFNDDGEPSGTAGSPIFQVLKGYDLYNVIVVVIRYFGGTKLGTGGLIKTYGGVASRAIKDAVIKKQYITKTIKLKYPYELSGIVSGILDQFNAEIVDSSYTIDIQQIIQIRIDFESKFCDYLKNQTSGKIFIDKR